MICRRWHGSFVCNAKLVEYRRLVKLRKWSWLSSPLLVIVFITVQIRVAGLGLCARPLMQTAYQCMGMGALHSCLSAARRGPKAQAHSDEQ